MVLFVFKYTILYNPMYILINKLTYFMLRIFNFWFVLTVVSNYVSMECALSVADPGFLNGGRGLNGRGQMVA